MSLSKRLLFSMLGATSGILSLAAGAGACGDGSQANSPGSGQPGGASDASVPSDARLGGEAAGNAEAESEAMPGPASDSSAVADTAAGPTCDQTLIPYPLPPGTAKQIVPTVPIQPFYQWENNDGYCGEVAVMQAGLNSGQWIDQFNTRLLCGAYIAGGATEQPALQAGPADYCSKNQQAPYKYAQLLFDPCGATGCADANTCLSNARLAHESYVTAANQGGSTALQAYLSWVKQKVIDGAWVTVGVLWANGCDDEYDHIVSVTRIGTNHDPTDATYYPDDVLYFDDHGLYTFENGVLSGNTAIPPGAGTDPHGCTPYVFSDTFANLSLGRTHMPKNSSCSSSGAAGGTQPYAFATPVAGGASNYAFAVTGPVDGDHSTLPVVMRIVGSTTGGAPNPADPRAGYNYETPFIGTSTEGSSCTDDPPTSWMQITAQVTVSGLTAGTAYNLYEYDFASVSGVGSAAALAVPTSGFNANASTATHATPFKPTGSSFTETVTFASNQVVVFRAVPASAP
jgi:hypothetical protein